MPKIHRCSGCRRPFCEYFSRRKRNAPPVDGTQGHLKRESQLINGFFIFLHLCPRVLSLRALHPWCSGTPASSRFSHWNRNGRQPALGVNFLRDQRTSRSTNGPALPGSRFLTGPLERRFRRRHYSNFQVRSGHRHAITIYVFPGVWLLLGSPLP